MKLFTRARRNRVDERLRAAEERALAAERAAADAKEASGTLLRVIAETPFFSTAVNTQGSRYPLYAFDDPIKYATPHNPNRRPESWVTIKDLRRAADTYDILRSCIQHLKREVSSAQFSIIARDDKSDSTKHEKRIGQAEAWFEAAGGLGGFGKRRSQFESLLIEDLCIVGAAAIWIHPTRGGKPYEAIPINAATIRPIVDAYGWPGIGDIAYEQWIQGRVVNGYRRDQLIYDGLFPATDQPYFRSQVEWLLLSITGALAADEWNRTWLTDGTTPSDLLAVPEHWTPDMIKQYHDWATSLLTGNIRERVKLRLVPSGTSRLANPSRQDQQFAEYEMFLLKKTCAIMGVQPASIGFTGDQYKVSQNASFAQTTQFGAAPFLDFFKNIYDDFLIRLGFPDLEVRNDVPGEENKDAKADRILKSCGVPWLTINEARAEAGLEPITEGDILMVPSGATSLQNAINPDENASLNTADKMNPGRENRKPADTSKNETLVNKSGGVIPNGGTGTKKITKPERQRASGELLKWQKKVLSRLGSERFRQTPFESPDIPDEAAAIVRGGLLRIPADRFAVFSLFDHAETVLRTMEEEEERAAA